MDKFNQLKSPVVTHHINGLENPTGFDAMAARISCNLENEILKYLCNGVNYEHRYLAAINEIHRMVKIFIRHTSIVVQFNTRWLF
jgi:hypothetical protein